MKDPHITLATTMPRLSSGKEGTNQVLLDPCFGATKQVFGYLWCLNNKLPKELMAA